MKWILIIPVLAIIAGFSFIYRNKPHKNKTDSSPVIQPANSFALLELFTSEGCSSCPPADKLLPELESINPNIISLSFHVDYWDRLGWKDPFSNAAFTDRQRQYGQQFQLESIYTPQLIINGEYELVGSNRSTAEADIKKALRDKILMEISIDEVKKENKRLYITCHTTGDWKNTGILTAIVQKHAETDVKAGENEGVKLLHTNVVRSFVKQPAHQLMKFDIEIPNDIEDDNWAVVMYAQQTGNGKITGATIYDPATSNKKPATGYLNSQTSALAPNIAASASFNSLNTSFTLF